MLSEKPMKITDKIWKPFPMGAIFVILPGKRLEKINMIPGSIPFVGSSDRNNGITAYCGNMNESLDANVLGLNYNGSVCEAFYHPYMCLFSDDVKRLKLAEYENNKYVLLFIGTCIKQQKVKYMYSYKFNEKRMRSQYILLPTRHTGEPDYEFMESFVKEMIAKKIKLYRDYTERQVKLGGGGGDCAKCAEWKSFSMAEIFEIGHGFYNKKPPCAGGDIPFVGASASNNGVTGWTTLEEVQTYSKTGHLPNEPIERKLFHGGTIAVVNNGNPGYSYYQPSLYTSTHDVNPLTLRHRKMTPELAMFLIPMVQAQGVCFEYSRKWRPKRMVRSRFLLPVNKRGEPDWEYMEACGRQMVLKKYRQYLDFLNSRNG